jgi:hypothetical protein
MTTEPDPVAYIAARHGVPQAAGGLNRLESLPLPRRAQGLVPTEVAAASPAMASRHATRSEDAIYAQDDAREPSASGIAPMRRVAR